jgi:hypothetical protein
MIISGLATIQLHHIPPEWIQKGWRLYQGGSRDKDRKPGPHIADWNSDSPAFFIGLESRLSRKSPHDRTAPIISSLSPRDRIGRYDDTLEFEKGDYESEGGAFRRIAREPGAPQHRRSDK